MVFSKQENMIRVFNNAEELSSVILALKSKGKTIGFVPTMGALHDGHLKLVKKAKKENNIAVVSIFVNPTQFNDKKDLEKYPRNLEDDLLKLMPTKVNFVYAPEVSDIYPNGTEEGAAIDLGGLDETMEGAFRPGHFKGVAQVVKRLLDIVQPDHLYMGQKDFQQFTIIEYIITKLKIDTHLVVCPIVREKNGLAMSSRNVRLSQSTREAAGLIYKTLKSIKKQVLIQPVEVVKSKALQKLKTGAFEPEYLEIVDGYTLQSVIDMNQHDYVVACTVVKADGVRLLDNIILKKV
jgi:pantoate--beta-alanine ligase